MLDRLTRRGAHLVVAALGAGALIALPGAAQNGPFDPDVRPEFSYPSTPVDMSLFSPPRPPPWASPALGDGPFDLQSYEQRNYRVSVVARGLVQPRSLQFLPNGDLLVAEIEGRLRLVRDGALRAEPIAGMPEVYGEGTNGLRDMALHPDFAENGLVYFTYDKPAWGDLGVPAVYRGRWTGEAIADGQDIFIADDVETGVSRLEFGSDGKLYVTIGGPANGEPARLDRAQHPDDYAGKILRLNDDGSAPEDNPFVGAEGYNPEIFTLGHRNATGLAVNPWTGELWSSEQGPNGGDEVNVLEAGGNYGWPVVSDGRDYRGPFISDAPLAEGFARPRVGFIPSPALTGIVFYTGDRFPAWRRNLFVGASQFGETPRTGHLLRISFNENWEELAREMLLLDLHQRIRDVAQGPDGLIYAITAENEAVVLRLEPLEGAE
jgi:glucose/arabinose dehydrogenase